MQNPAFLAVSATFTAEPIEAPLQFWLTQWALPLRINFAPYQQVFQQLVDPTSLFATNEQGCNVLLLRLADLCRSIGGVEYATELQKVSREMATALRAAAARSKTPYLIIFAPHSPKQVSNAADRAAVDRAEEELRASVVAVSNVYFLGPEAFAPYEVPEIFDARREELGHIPFTEAFYTVLATVVSRAARALRTPPKKVLVIDCDNTLWRGVVGEDGVTGIEVSSAHQAFQSWLVEQQQSGKLICLCSKNTEADVFAVFESNAKMVLRKEHLTAWRINWDRKSQNIQAIADELSLGTDSFVFLDDSPTECAEVRAVHPRVTAVQVPQGASLGTFARHLWLFDQLRVTAEDRKRTKFYADEKQRREASRQAPDFATFLQSLAVRITMREPTEKERDRAAQLTQRTNQFRFHDVRLTPQELAAEEQKGLRLRVLEVTDRFGDYGIVGLILFRAPEPGTKRLVVEDFMLSCRVLGKGVEQETMRLLLAEARQAGASEVSFRVVATGRNQPARAFLETLGKKVEARGTVVFPSDYVVAAPTSAVVVREDVDQTAVKIKDQDESVSVFAQRLVDEYSDVSALVAAVRRSALHDVRPLTQFVAPRTEIERRLGTFWKEVLRVTDIGLDDDFFAAGGTSLLAVSLVAALEKFWKRELSLSFVVENPTIRAMAKHLEDPHLEDESNVVRMTPGGGKPFFLVYDGLGEILLYGNWARALGPEFTCYGVRPVAKSERHRVWPSMQAMGAYYAQQLKRIQPAGPYRLGGLCAGGGLAFAMASELERAGEEVQLLAILETSAPGVVLREEISLGGRFERLMSTLFGPGPASRVSRVRAASGMVYRRVATSLRFRIRRVRLSCQLFTARMYARLGVAGFYSHVSLMEMYDRLFADYRPQQKLRAPVLLFFAGHGTGLESPKQRFTDVPELGWPQFLARKTAWTLTAGHTSILVPPDVTVIADECRKAIASSDATAARQRVA